MNAARLAFLKAKDAMKVLIHEGADASIIDAATRVYILRMDEWLATRG